MINETTKFVAYTPNGISAPIAFLSVRVPEGEVTMNVWLSAMAARVQLMLSKKLFKKRAAKNACKELHCPPCDDLDKFGEHIVTNSGLTTWIKLYFSVDNPFPEYVTEDHMDALLSLTNENLDVWVGNARFVGSGILLSDRLRFFPS